MIRATTKILNMLNCRFSIFVCRLCMRLTAMKLVHHDYHARCNNSIQWTSYAFTISFLQSTFKINRDSHVIYIIHSRRDFAQNLFEACCAGEWHRFFAKIQQYHQLFQVLSHRTYCTFVARFLCALTSLEIRTYHLW